MAEPTMDGLSICPKCGWGDQVFLTRHGEPDLVCDRCKHEFWSDAPGVRRLCPQCGEDALDYNMSGNPAIDWFCNNCNYEHAFTITPEVEPKGD